jgi:soluble lytic murein transglycosylase-like protein
MARLLDSLFRISPPRLDGKKRGPLLLAVLVVCTAAYGYGPAVAQMDDAGGSAYARNMLRSRLNAMKTALTDVQVAYTKQVEPIEKVLLRYRHDDPRLVKRVAVSIVRESKRSHVEPRLLMGMMLVENPMLDPNARSIVGASGLMQVMPLHQGKWGCGTRLDDVESNICTGSRIFADALKSERGNVTEALLRYNGCVSGSTTPDCHAYPRYVLARARYVR